MNLIKCYLFGDKIEHAAFQNAIMDALAFQRDTPVLGLQHHISPPIVKFVFEALAHKDSPIKVFLIDLHIHGSIQIPSNTKAEIFHPDYLLGVMKGLLKGRAPSTGLSPQAPESVWKYHLPRANS